MPLIQLTSAQIESMIADLDKQITEAKSNLANEIEMCFGSQSEIEQVERDYKPGIEKLERQLADLKASLLPETDPLAQIAKYNNMKLALAEQRMAVSALIKPIAMRLAEMRCSDKGTRDALWRNYQYTGFDLCPIEGITAKFGPYRFEYGFTETFPVSYLTMTEAQIAAEETFNPPKTNN